MGEGGPTYAARSLPQYNSAFATRVLQSTYVCVKGEKAWAWIFKLFRTSGINSTELVAGHWHRHSGIQSLSLVPDWWCTSKLQVREKNSPCKSIDDCCLCLFRQNWFLGNTSMRIFLAPILNSFLFLHSICLNIKIIKIWLSHYPGRYWVYTELS